MSIRFMAPAHGQPAMGDAAGADASFFDDDAVAGSPHAPAALPTDVWSGAASALHQPAAAYAPRHPSQGSGGGTATGWPPFSAPTEEQTERQPLAATRSLLTRAGGMQLQPAHQPQPQALPQQHEQQIGPRTAAEQQQGTAPVGIPFLGAPDDDELFPASGTSSGSPKAAPVGQLWLPAPSSVASQPYADRVSGTLQPVTASIAQAPVHASEELRQPAPAVSTWHTQITPSLPVDIAFTGTGGAGDDDAAFEFASLTPRGEEPGSPLAVGSWSNPAGSAVLQSFRLPPSSIGNSSDAAVANSAAAVPAAAASATQGNHRATAPDAAQNAAPPGACGTTSRGQPVAPPMPTAAASWAAAQIAAEPSDRSYGAAARPAVQELSQPRLPPSPRPPRSPSRVQGAASTGVAKFRGWQHGKRGAAAAPSSGGADRGEEAPDAAHLAETGRRPRLPPAHSASLDRWLPTLQADDTSRSGSDATAPSISSARGMEAEMATPGSLHDLPHAALSSPRPAVQVRVPPLPASTAPSVAAPMNGAGRPPAAPVSLPAPDVSADSKAGSGPQPNSAAHGEDASGLSESQADAHVLKMQLADAAADLAHGRADTEALRSQLQRRDMEVAGMEVQRRADEAETAALRRQLEEHQTGA